MKTKEVTVLYAICDKQNIVKHYSGDIRYVTTQPNGVTIGTTAKYAEAIYCNETDTYWPIKETYAGQDTYVIYQVDSIPSESFEPNITRYNNGSLELIFETAEEALKYKLPLLSSVCEKTIISGASISLSTGEKAFSYTEKDQINISEMFSAIIMGAAYYPYHENDGQCEMFPASDIIAIYTTLSMLKTSQLTYFNQLKHYAESLTMPEEVLSIQYGQELTGEYLQNYNDIISKTQEQLNSILSKISGQNETEV